MINLRKLLHINRSSAMVSFVAMVLPVVGSVLSIYLIINYPEVTMWVKSHREVFFLGTACTMAVLLTPTTFIASLSGFMFGLVSAFYLVPAYVIASLLGYFLGKRLEYRACQFCERTFFPSRRVTHVTILCQQISFRVVRPPFVNTTSWQPRFVST